MNKPFRPSTRTAAPAGRGQTALRPRDRLAALALTLAAAAGTATVAGALAAPADSKRSSLQFSFSQMGVSTTGNFRAFAADVAFDPAHPDKAKVEVSVDMAAADGGGPDANDLLKGRDFFDVAHFPKATFSASKVRAADAGSFAADGKLTIKGTTRDVTIPFLARNEGGFQIIEGSLPISRTAFHVGDGDWADTSTLVDAVNLKFKLLVPH